MKLSTVIETQQQLEENFRNSIPHDAWRVFGPRGDIRIIDGQISLTLEGDPLSIGEFRQVLEWWAEQLGGSISWGG